MPEATVYLVRHGMHDWLLPTSNRFAGALPGIGLNQQGMEEARRVAALLADEPLQWVASSPLQRTLETAEIIARDHGIDVMTDDRLLEWRLGVWEGMWVEDIRKRYPEEWTLWREAPDRLRLPGAETLQQVADRMEAAYRELAARGEIGVIVSHQDPLAGLLSRLIGAPLNRMRGLDIRTGSLSVCREASYGTIVVSINSGTALG